MGKKIKFEYTWCDYLTPCPHGRDCFVGDYDCSICPFCEKYIVNKTPNASTKIDDYGKYCKVYSGEITCKFTKNLDN